VELYDGAEWINPKGVPSDWATHMIGHELTAMYGIDHAELWQLWVQIYTE
jgi:alcohol dehydrogenase YqhD (iron-dependent ADH family)